jgi:glycosyltransferase involved in cell wall biosynthesis
VRGDVDWATGAVMLVRRRLLDTIGVFDESFFLYSEETEYCQRVRANGFKVRVDPSAVAVHLGGDLPTDERLWALRTLNRVRLYGRSHSDLSTLAFRAICATFEARRCLTGSRTSRRALLSLLQRDTELASMRLMHELQGSDVESREHRGRSVMPEGSGWVCYSAQDWWYHNQSHSDFQLMRGVARTEPVLLVNSIGMRFPMPGKTSSPGLRVLRKLRSAARFVRRPDPAVPWFHVMTPLFIPVYSRPLVRVVNGWLVHLQVAAASRWVGIRRPVVFVTLPTAWDAARHLSRRCLIMNRSDRYSALPEADASVVRPLEESLLKDADLVVYTSHMLLEEESDLVDDRARFLGHGVDVEHFAAGDVHPELTDVPRPRVGYFGGIDDFTVDLDLLRAVADHIEEAQLVLVGDASSCDISDLIQRPNVHWFGQRPYAEVPAFGAGFDVALMPWLDNDWIRHSNPIKLKEYLALGLPIVSTPFPELEHLPDGLVTSAAGADAFVAAVRAALVGTGSPTERRRAVSEETWANKVDVLRALAAEASRNAR